MSAAAAHSPEITTMRFRVNCPKCQTPYLCADEHRGKRLQCTKCRQQFVAGSAPASPAPTPPPTPKVIAVQAQPHMPAASAPRRIASASPSPRQGLGVAPSRSSARLILLGLLALLLVGAALGSAGTYWLMRGKETASATEEQAQVAQAESARQLVEDDGNARA
ncbi:MAG TPA: hypothetical protein VKE94_07855, partial [Gemmataceae bacterium]|nr:hypothetical protein [Gemmataceae bacterium]